jgi:hypothetical protein
VGLLSKALRGFHASPHKFDKVRIRENIGKGEGAQVYGNGFYIAEAEPTMESYYDIFKSTHGPLEVNGKPLTDFWDSALEENFPELFNGVTDSVRERLHVVLANLALANPADINSVIKGFTPLEAGTYDRFVKPKLKLLNWDKILGDQPDEIFDAVKPQLQKQQEIMAAARKRALDKGTDWKGRPLPSEKVESLSQPLKNIDEYTGEQVYKLMGITDDMGRPAKDQREGYQLAADRLHAAGIDGTKYLDKFSRPSMGNEDFPVRNPTHNYAIWNDDIINILRRYGIPISSTAAVGGLLSRLNSQSEA